MWNECAPMEHLFKPFMPLSFGEGLGVRLNINNMKKYLSQILALTMLLLVTQSCFQDLDNDPPFNFPPMPEVPPPPPPPADGLVFRMSFDGNFVEAQSEIAATAVGTPTFAPGVEGQAFQGATDSYLTFNISDLVYVPTDELTVAFWYNLNAAPDRAGVLTFGARPYQPYHLREGLRIFREGSPTSQAIVTVIGTGDGYTWLRNNDTGSLNPNLADWVHITITITDGRANLFFDGHVVATATPSGLNLEGSDIISIGSGAPNFAVWNHLSDLSLIDELHIFNRVLSETEIARLMNVNPPLEMGGQVFFTPFNHNFRDIVGGLNPTVEGTPALASGKVGQAFAGTVDSYLTFDIADILDELDNELTVAFWYNVNSTPDRAGIFTFAAASNDRTRGFRIFREGGTNMSVFVGTDNRDMGLWNAPLPLNEWVHVALVFDATTVTLYLDGEVIRSAGAPYFMGADWTGSTIASIGSGAPYFTEWNHLSDLSLIDELRIFNRALSSAEIAEIIEHAD